MKQARLGNASVVKDLERGVPSPVYSFLSLGLTPGTPTPLGVSPALLSVSPASRRQHPCRRQSKHLPLATTAPLARCRPGWVPSPMVCRVLRLFSVTGGAAGHPAVGSHGVSHGAQVALARCSTGSGAEPRGFWGAAPLPPPTPAVCGCQQGYLSAAGFHLASLP